jgi:predicted nucleic acid-binding protein
MEGPVVLDTSVLVKWYRQGEVLATEALQLREDHLAGRISIALPSLVAYELANVLHYKEDLSTHQVQAAVRSLFGMQMTWVAIERDDGTCGRSRSRSRHHGP